MAARLFFLCVDEWPSSSFFLVDAFCVVVQLFMSPYLERRLTGLMDIVRYADAVTRKDDYQMRVRSQHDRSPTAVAMAGPTYSPANTWLDAKYVNGLSSFFPLSYRYVLTLHSTFVSLPPKTSL